MEAAASFTLGIRIASLGAILLPVVVTLVIAVRSPISSELIESGGSLDKGSADDSDEPEPSRHPKNTRSTTSSGGAQSSASPDKDKPSAPVMTPSAEERTTLEAFTHALAMNDLRGALAKMKRLLELDPEAPRDDNVRAAIVDLTMRIMLVVGPEPDDMFDQLVNHMGTTGIDILYQLVTTKGGSRAATLAQKLLDRPDVVARGTEAVRLAYALRSSKSCEAKKALFPAIGEHGDGRSLGQLYLLNRECGRRHSDPTCCLHGDKDLDATIDAVQKRGFQ